MKFASRALIVATIIVASASMAESAKLLNLKMGPVWPKELSTSNAGDGVTAWEPSIEVGTLFADRIALGMDLEFQWKRRMDDTTYFDTLSGGGVVPRNVVDKVERFYMFPPSMFLLIDPVPDLIVHPVIKGQIGMTLLYYSNKWYVNNDDKKSVDSGLYYGVFGKASLDALYDIVDGVSVFVGFEYQWGNARKRVKDQLNQYYRKAIAGPGIRMGFRFVM